MELISVKEKFIQDLIQYLNDVNSREIENGKKPLFDVCFTVSVIDQNLGNYTEFLENISNGYELSGCFKSINYYSKGTIRILTSKNYYIEFINDERYMGYCQCKPEDEGYNEKYKCCGKKCDFIAPAFRLYEEVDLRYSTWDGLEKDYWTYKEKFEINEKNKNEEVERFKKEKKKQEIEDKIMKLQVELMEIEDDKYE